MCNLEGKIAELLIADNGYRIIRLIEKCGDQWLVEVVGSGKEMYVSEEESSLNDD